VATRAELLDIARQAMEEGDEATAQAVMDDIERLPTDSGTITTAADVPVAPGISAATSPKNTIPDPSFLDKVVGAGEAALTLGTGATSGLFGNIAGAISGVGKTIANGSFGTDEGGLQAGAEAASTGANLTYMPKTVTGKGYVGAIGETLAPLAAVAPFTQELSIIGQGARSAMPAVEFAARNEAAILRPSIAPKKIETINKLRARDTDNSLAPIELEVINPTLKDAQGKLLPEAYKIVDDNIAKEAIKQGFNDGLVQAVKVSDKYNSKKMLEMLNISEKGKRNAVYGSENRPTDIIGDSLAQNIQYVKKVNKEAGAEIDKAAKALEGQRVDVSDPVNNFANDLADKVKVKLIIDKDGKIKPDFRGSDIEGKMYAPEQRLVSMIVDRMANTKAPDAYDVHRLKRAIDQTVVYGKSNSKSLWPDVENSVKSLRKNLDSTLDKNFESYNAANTKYSETIQALDNFQKTAGSKIDLFGEGADKQLGILSRRLLSNVQSSQELSNAIKQIQETGKAYGNKVPDDIMAQITFANELDNMFGPAAKSSLAGEQSAGTKAAMRDLSRSHGIYDLAARGIQAAADKARGVNEGNAYKSMRELLAKQISKKQEKDAAD